MNGATQFLTRLGVRQQYHKWVWLMLGLAVIRFAVVPVLDWQQEKLDSIEFLSLQTRNPEEIVEREAQIEKIAAVSEQRLTELLKYYRQDSSLKEAELKIARQVEGIAEQYGLSVTSRSWATDYQEDYFAKQHVRLVIEGYIDQLQPFLMKLEAHRQPFYFIEKLDVNNRGGGAKFKANLTVSQLTRLVSEESTP